MILMIDFYMFGALGYTWSSLHSIHVCFLGKGVLLYTILECLIYLLIFTHVSLC